jgi:hypothetical protein
MGLTQLSPSSEAISRCGGHNETTVGVQYDGSGLSQGWLWAFAAGQNPGKSGNYEELQRLAAALALDSISAAVTRRGVLAAAGGEFALRESMAMLPGRLFRHFVAGESLAE